MADGNFATLVSKDRNDNAISNPIYVQFTDGTDVALITAAGELLVSATDLDIRDLTHVSDSVKVGDGTDFLAVNADGSVNVQVPFDYAVDSVAGATDLGALILAVRDDALTTLTPADGDYVQLRTDSTGALWVNIGAVTNLDIRDLTHVSDSVKVGDGTDFLGVNSDGSINVNIVNAAISGEVHNYDTGTVTGGGTDTHTVTASGGTLLVNQVVVSSSAGVKFEIQNNAVTVGVGFLRGRDGDTKIFTFNPPLEVADTQAITVIKTNRQLVSADIYSTVMGRQL